MAEQCNQNHSAKDKMNDDKHVDDKFRNGKNDEECCNMKPNGQTSGKDASKFEKEKCEQEKERKAS